MAYCTECGFNNRRGASFCAHCGRSMGNTEPVYQPPTRSYYNPRGYTIMSAIVAGIFIGGIIFGLLGLIFGEDELYVIIGGAVGGIVVGGILGGLILDVIDATAGAFNGALVGGLFGACFGGIGGGLFIGIYRQGFFIGIGALILGAVIGAIVSAIGGAIVGRIREE